MSHEGPGQPEDPLLDVKEAAARAGMKPSSWRAAVSREYAPQPDDPDKLAHKYRRRPRWRLSTVSQFVSARPGRGRRSDLVKARKERSRRTAADLAEIKPTAGPELREWLQQNHRALLAVAEVLVDHRDTLLAAVGHDNHDLASAIDRAGEEMSSHPSRLLAAAVTYAQFLLRSVDPNHLPPDVREVLARHRDLHAEFNGLRDQGSTQ